MKQQKLTSSYVKHIIKELKILSLEKIVDIYLTDIFFINTEYCS